MIVNVKVNALLWIQSILQKFQFVRLTIVEIIAWINDEQKKIREKNKWKWTNQKNPLKINNEWFWSISSILSNGAVVRHLLKSEMKLIIEFGKPNDNTLTIGKGE